jgi:hypothetical protein
VIEVMLNTNATLVPTVEFAVGDEIAIAGPVASTRKVCAAGVVSTTVFSRARTRNV